MRIVKSCEKQSKWNKDLDTLIKCYLRFHKFQIKNDAVHPKIEFS